MGQKVNPHGLRVGIIKEWDSRWYAGKKTFGDTLVQDYNLREFIKGFVLPGNSAAGEKAEGENKNERAGRPERNRGPIAMSATGVARIEIERLPDKLRINIHCAKPGLVIGSKGAGIEALKAAIAKKFNLNAKALNLNIVEIQSIDLSAQLVAEKIAADLENRVSFRRAMKGSIGRTMKAGAKGIKIKCGGRLGGAEIARSECYHEGTIPLQTIRADIDYGFAEANTTYGRIGVKVWIYKGEILKGDAAKAAASRDRFDKKPERPRRRREDRNGERRDGERRPRRDFNGDRAQNGERRPRNDRPQGGHNRREGGSANAASKES